MGSGEPRRLIINADDFGRSSSINRAVVQAHREGILTTASLMVNGDAAAEAVQLACETPTLGVGLHLTLVCGRAALTRAEIPGLVQADDSFSDAPVTTGLRLFFRGSLREQVRRELAAQFQKFARTGLVLDHVNGHLNLHLHPVVFRLLLQHAREWNIQRMRLTRDPLRLNFRLAKGRWAYRVSHGIIFRLLSDWAEPKLVRQRIGFTPRVFGLLQNAHVNESYLLDLVRHLPEGNSELYSHPCADKFKPELDALVSPRVRALVHQQQIQLVRYQDL